MRLEERIELLNHKTKSSIRLKGFKAQDKGFQQTCHERYLQYLPLDDEKKTGFRDTVTRFHTKDEGKTTEATVKETQNIVWTERGPMIRTVELGINTHKGGPYDKYHNVTLEGYFLMPSKPKEDIPPRYEYALVNKSFYYNGSGEVASYVEGIVKVDDTFSPLSEAMAPRESTSDKAFSQFERQFSSELSVAQSLPVDVSALRAAEQQN